MLYEVITAVFQPVPESLRASCPSLQDSGFQTSDTLQYFADVIVVIKQNHSRFVRFKIFGIVGRIGHNDDFITFVHLTCCGTV